MRLRLASVLAVAIATVVLAGCYVGRTAAEPVLRQQYGSTNVYDIACRIYAQEGRPSYIARLTATESRCIFPKDAPSSAEKLRCQARFTSLPEEQWLPDGAIGPGACNHVGNGNRYPHAPGIGLG